MINIGIQTRKFMVLVEMQRTHKLFPLSSILENVEDSKKVPLTSSGSWAFW